MPEINLDLADFDGEPLSLRDWCRQFNWAVTTESDCYGEPPRDGEGFALYDANEDDPPIAIFTFKEDAEQVAAILNEFGRRGSER